MLPAYTPTDSRSDNEAPVARTLDHTVHTVRRDAILDAAELFIRTRGYDQMSIQAIQDELGVSRGAIYHYFGSKADILEAVLDRMGDAAFALLEPIVADPDLAAPAKLQTVFATAGRWKTERSDVLLPLIRSWYSEDNDLVRLRLERIAGGRLRPLIARIVRQGTAEGAFKVTSPDETAALLVALLYAAGDAVGWLLVHPGVQRPYPEASRIVAAYGEAIERVLGLSAGSFELMDEPTLRFWFG